jgi:dTMP kinase
MRLSAFIVFEGGDGSGKSTQARALLRRLHQQGHPACLTREPGGTPLGETIRRWLKGGRNLAPSTELFLFAAARAQLVQEIIRPSLQSGITVICDRFTASTVAYQGYGRGLDLALIQKLNRVASGGLTPDLTALLDLPAEVGLVRKHDSGTDTYDAAPLEFHRRVREGYLWQAGQHPQDWLILDATQPRRVLAQEIWARVQTLL